MEQETAGTETVRTTGRLPGGETGGPGGGRRHGLDRADGNGSPGSPARGRRTRAVTAAVLIVCLIMAGLTRHWAIGMQQRATYVGPQGGREGAIATGGASLGSMDSFSLALLLGGLRGPLVMFLWTEIENRKNDRDLEDVDTMIEMVRLLQPEFDSVHIFQSWNKAYNISAQVASLPNKYSVVLDALAYLENVDDARPNSLNILQSIGQIYNHKLGTTTGDSIYYRRRVREDSKWRPESEREVRREGVPPRRLKPLLDPEGNLLPELVAPENPRPPGLSESQEWYDGSDLQFLKKYEPFPYGVSPLALGYNYAKRAQVLMNLTRQKPKQLSESVVDSRPALMLKEWSDEEWERARELEMRAFGVPVPAAAGRDRHVLEAPTAGLPLDTPVDDLNGESKQARLLREAIYSYELSARLARDSRAEYARHLSNTENYINQFQNFSSHVDQLTAQEHMAAADGAYLKAMALPPGRGRNAAIRTSFENYRAANVWYQYSDLRYYTPLEVFPPNVPREKLAELRDRELKGSPPDGATDGMIAGERPLSRVAATVEENLKKFQGVDINFYERAEYAAYQERARLRAQLLLAAARAAIGGGGGGASPTSSPVTQPSP